MSNLRPCDLNSLSFHVMVFQFEFDLYRKYKDHYESCILVPYYTHVKSSLKSIQNIIFQAHCTQTHTHIHLHTDLQKQNMSFLCKLS